MMSKQIIGRKAEREVLERAFRSNKSEFVIVYGRRRVGKTFLINQHFQEQFTFRVIGSLEANNQRQLLNFYDKLCATYPALISEVRPTDWFEAFKYLERVVEESPHERKVIFIDELPWFDRKGADFVSALSYFWNSWANLRTDVLLICCGSAASWMMSKIIHSKGGLHNRVTQRIQLQPFTLAETEAFLKSLGSVYDRYQILSLYMAIGGIPFYLEALYTNRSVHQNIDRLFFSSGGLLQMEYQDLYQSLFKQHSRHIAVVEALAAHPRGMSRDALLNAAKLSDGGSMSVVLSELEASGFIRRVFPYGRQQRDVLIQLVDHYTLFYLRFVKNTKATGDGAWLSLSKKATWHAWSGLAFEMICHTHLPAIKRVLGIQGVYTEASHWQSKTSDPGAQIDLLIDRDDHQINICEAKFTIEPFVIDEAYAAQLQYKLQAFKMEEKVRKTLMITLISASGVYPNALSAQVIQDVLSADALFADI
jgi:uncharacterized protein